MVFSWMILFFSHLAFAHQYDWRDVKSPTDQEVCFSPEEPCGEKLVKMVESAQQSIDMAIYDINLDPLVHALLVQSKKIPVRVVVDQRQAKGRHSLVKTLIRGGIAVRYGKQRGIMHNKFTVVDHRMVELGSFNYTHHARGANHENQIYLTAPAIVRRYSDRFEKIWSSAKLFQLQ